MTVGELRDFCEAREVEISMRYSQDYDSIIIEIRKNGRSANMAIPRDIAVAKKFGVVARAMSFSSAGSGRTSHPNSCRM